MEYQILRLSFLDSCLRNEGTMYTVDDLTDKCNERLERAHIPQISKRTIYNDLNLLQRSPYNAVLKKSKSGHNTVYRYQDTKCSIPYLHLNEEDTGIVHRTIELLEKFKGLPQYDWVRIILRQLEIEQNVENDENIVSFQNNTLLNGIEHFEPLLGAIINKQPLTITYQRYESEPKDITIHPYHLKQYNNRWFLVAREAGREDIAVYPFDRIRSIKQIKTQYQECGVDIEEYFDDVVGVTVNLKESVQTIKLRVFHKRYNYIETKPIHPSQTLIRGESDENFKVITIKARWNRELEALLLSFGRDMEVLEPIEIREKFRKTIKGMATMYNIDNETEKD